MRAIRIGLCLLVLLLMIGGCQKLLGDYTLDETSSASCTPRVVQCVGNVLQRCNGTGSAWENAAVCASETLCDTARGMCKQPVCAAGARQCLGAELQGCNAARDGWVQLATCPTAGHCSVKMGACTEQPCMPGKTQCNGAVLQTCRPDQSGWDDGPTCESAGLCDAEQGTCMDSACQPGQFRCDGPSLKTCNESLTGWTAVETCHSDALCNATTGSCGAVVCTTPGAFRCDAAGVLERCADDLTGWMVVEACNSAAHCDARNGMCDEAPCKPGDRQCNGSKLEVCNAASTGWDLVGTCQTDGLCQETLEQNETSCMQAVCEMGTFQCIGAQPQICAASLTEYRDNGEPCLTPELCNSATGTCAEPVCDAGQTRCTGAVPEICNAGRTMFVPHGGTACASATLCRPETGTCGNVVCLSGQKRCDPDDPTRLQICNATFDGWDECDTCATAELCSASLGAATCGATSCTEPSCNLTDRWCDGTDDRSLYQCPSSRIKTQAAALGTCDSKELCQLTLDEPGRLTCLPKLCSLPDRWCGGEGNRTLYKCPPSLLNYQAIELDECATNGLCLQAHANPTAVTCPEPACAASGYSCGGTGSRVLQYCNPERTALATCDTCDSAALCTASLNATACNASACDVCLPGQKMCSGTQLQVCNATGTGWATAATCGSAALCMNSLLPATQMTCDACVEGAFSCNGAQPRTCNDPGTGPAVWANLGNPCASAAACNTDGTCDPPPMGEGGAGGTGGGGGAGEVGDGGAG